MLQARGKDGMSLSEVLQQERGLVESEIGPAVAAAAVPSEQISEYIEVHMEQVGGRMHGLLVRTRIGLGSSREALHTALLISFSDIFFHG